MATVRRYSWSWRSLYVSVSGTAQEAVKPALVLVEARVRRPELHHQCVNVMAVTTWGISSSASGQASSNWKSP